MLAKRCMLSRNAANVVMKRATSSSAGVTTPSMPASLRQYQKVIPLVAASVAFGFFAGRQSVPRPEDDHLHLPNGLPRTCCESPKLTDKQVELHKTLKRIVGKANVLDGMGETTENAPYLKGARLGKGSALYIVKPTKLKQLIEVVQEVVDADCCILVQGSNTGLVSFVFLIAFYFIFDRQQLIYSP